MKCEGSEMLVGFTAMYEFAPGISAVGGPTCRVCGADVEFIGEPGDLRAAEHEFVKYDGPPKCVYIPRGMEGTTLPESMTMTPLAQ